jgi:FkbM family methyltransferase
MWSQYIKILAINTRLYRPARWLSRRLRPAQLRAHREQVNFYRSWLPANALCFDVGANIGEKSEALLMAGARVVAFEPNPCVLPELKARCLHDSRWSLVAAAMGSGPAIASLYARRNTGQSSLAQEWGNGPVSGVFHVPVITLDLAIQTYGMPFFCKIDVEGWELEVLNGLSQPVPWLSFEFHLNEEGIARTLGCLRRLVEFGQAQVNIGPAERAAFFWQEWLSLEHFLDWFPGDLKQSLPGDTYGDIYVRSAPSIAR